MAIAKKKSSAKTAPVAKNSVTLHGIVPYVLKPKEEYMNENQLNHFKLILHAWRNELMEEVDRTVTHMKEFSLELRTRDRERKLIKKIDKTLVRVEEDDYGYCDQCGVEIGIRRLEARPTAELCIDCKTLDEIKEKQITGG